MFSIILVDDEQEIRESISELIKWKEFGFEFFGSAENGLDALRLMEQRVPDVLITDIRMPVMDGIELAKRVREEHPTVKVIFLSGYDKFEFAVSGIKLNIASYLLKPISRKELEETLQDIRIQLEEERYAATDMQTIEKGYMENIDIMKITFLISLLTENYTNLYFDELIPFLKHYNLKFLLKKKVMLNIRFNDPDLKERTASQKEELLRFSLSNMVQKVVSKYVQAEVFLFASNVICLIGDEERMIEESLDILAKEIYENAKKIYEKPITIGISEQYDRIVETKNAFQSTIEAINYARVYGKGSIVSISDIDTPESKQIGLTEELESQLLLAIKLGNKKELKTLIDNVFSGVFSSSARFQSNMRLVLGEVFIICMRAMRESGVELEEKHVDQFAFSQDMMEYEHVENMKKRVLSFCSDMMEKIKAHREQQTTSIAQKGERYIQTHFADSGLSMKKVSQELLISPSYFSSVFKKENGQSFTEKLTEIRMKKAKELVLSTDLKMFEIATQCGFTDQHYFSYSFKRYYTQSPSKMRREIRQTEND